MEAAASEEGDLRRAGEVLEQLLEELREMAGAPVWTKVEELVGTMMRMYGAGLSRILATLVDDNGALVDRLAADGVVASLLLMHGLHPTPLGERVAQAAERTRHSIGVRAGGIAVVEVARPRAHLRLVGRWDGCPVPRASVEQALARALAESAPEIREIVVDGVDEWAHEVSLGEIGRAH